MNKIFVEKRLSKNQKEYICLYVDLGYKQLVLSFNDSDIAQIIGVSVKFLYDLEVANPIYAGDLTNVLSEV